MAIVFYGLFLHYNYPIEYFMNKIITKTFLSLIFSFYFLCTSGCNDAGKVDSVVKSKSKDTQTAVLSKPSKEPFDTVLFNKKMKALEEVILRVMKQNNIGALDLKSSGGRVLYKKQKRQAGLGQKNMVKLMSEHMQSEEKATELMKYIQEHREVVMKESVVYEKTE